MLSRNLLASAFVLGGVLWGSLATPCWAMEKEDDARSALTVTTLPPEIRLEIFSYLSPKTLSRIARVSKEWNALSNDNMLWDRFLKKLDFPIIKGSSSKSRVISALSKETVNSIIHNFWKGSFQGIAIAAINERFVDLGYKDAIIVKIIGLLTGKDGYAKDPQTAVVLNDKLVAEKNLKAIGRKIEGLLKGTSGYTQDLQAGKDLCEEWAKKGHPLARDNVLQDLGWVNSSKDNSSLAIELNDTWANEGDLGAIFRKLYCLNRAEDNMAFIEWAIGMGSSYAIDAKRCGLLSGGFGYIKDKEALTEFEKELGTSTNPAIIEYYLSMLPLSLQETHLNGLLAQDIPTAIQFSMARRIYGKMEPYKINQELLDIYIKLLAND